jgi:hypothetical protein
MRGGSSLQSPECPASASAYETKVRLPERGRCDSEILLRNKIRCMLHRNQSGPLAPPGLRMAEALKEVRASIKKGLWSCSPTNSSKT